VAERIVGVGLTGVRLDALVGGIVSVGVLSACCGKTVSHATSNVIRIAEDTVDIRFDVFIDESISALQYCDN
jgi:hypothetical protein